MENTQNNISPDIESEELLSNKVVAEFTRVMTDIIDDRIRKRLSQEDVIKVYNAEIIDFSTTEKMVTYNVTEGTTTTSISHSFTVEEISSITVTYDNDFSVVISNSSVKQIPIEYLSGIRKKWVKICTYDGVQFYVLHTL